jgi:hypothetical protein
VDIVHGQVHHHVQFHGFLMGHHLGLCVVHHRAILLAFLLLILLYSLLNTKQPFPDELQ